MRNIVLLNLSDMHCLAGLSRQQEVFSSFLSGLKEFVREYPAWKPDFIVIPGDVVEGQQVGKAYENARKFIKEVVTWCGLDMTDVVVVPGNHDRNCPREKTEENKKEFEKIKYIFDRLQDPESDKDGQKRIKGMVACCDGFGEHGTDGKMTEMICEKTNNDKMLNDFCVIQDQYFQAYSDFASSFCETDAGTKDGRFYPVKCLGKHPCGLTMGYKVFDRLKIVFLMLNTEWVQFPSFSGVSEIKTGGRFVKELINTIREEYPDYLVVSVMHRPPYQWEWEEKNVYRMNLYNPYHMFLDVSDVAISGHNHLISSRNEPEFLAGKVQHFQLGALACSPDGGDVFLNAASLIKIDAISNEAEMTYATLGLEGASMKWYFDTCDDRYPLRGRYGKMRSNRVSAVPSKSKFRVNDVDIVWTKRNVEIGLTVNNEDKEYVDRVKRTNDDYIKKEILRHHYYGQSVVSEQEPDVFRVDGDVVCIWPLHVWMEGKRIERTCPVHYIIYSSKIEDSHELQKEKQRFLLSGKMLKDIFSIVIVQNN